MRILIIGGGIAGTAAGLALRKAGFEPTVYESHPDGGEDIGAFLTLASNGMRALAQIDAAETVAEAGFPLTALRLLDASGTELADRPMGAHDDPLTRFRCLHRAELGAVLRQEVRRRGIAIVHGARLSGLSESTDGITAEFADGRTATGDLLIGADGLNSTVRSLISPAEPHYAGQRVFYGYAADIGDAALAGAKPGYITMIRGSAAAFGYACSPDGEVFWFARVSGPAVSVDEITGTSPDQWRELLLPLLRPDATPAADIVAATGEQLMVTNAWDLPIGLPWRTPRAVLIGDAAHAASPATGLGASMALEDAVILGKALRDEAGIEAALDKHEQLRRGRVEENIVASAALSAGRTPPRAPVGAAPSDEELIRQLEWASPHSTEATD